MDTYSVLREFADSWALLALTVFYLGAILWLFRPGARALHEDAANLPFRHEDAPVAGCGKGCPDCSCGRVYDFLPEERE